MRDVRAMELSAGDPWPTITKCNGSVFPGTTHRPTIVADA